MSSTSAPYSSGPEPVALTSIFVYGTLMPGERWEKIAQQGGEYRAQRATLEGALLADLRPEGYPALFELSDVQANHHPAHPAPVIGWLYTYTPQSWAAALPFLDDLEGLHLTPPLYRRAQVTVQTATGPQPAWVYFYARLRRVGQPGLSWVTSGQWQDVPDRHHTGERITWEG